MDSKTVAINSEDLRKLTVENEQPQETKYEPLLDEKNDRLTIAPIQFQDIWQAYKKQEGCIWHAHEVELDKDYAHWQTLTTDEQFFLKRVLAFFASSDKLVAMNLMERFMQEIKVPEVLAFYALQNFMENVHSEVYSNMILAYVKNATEREQLLNAVETIPCVGEKAAWAQKWIGSEDPFAQRLVAFAIVEGVFFSGSFCAIYWLNERGVMPGLAKGNDFIARDEGLHTSFACMLYKKYINNKMPHDRFAEIIREAVTLEINFITEALPCRLLGMNSSMMIQYIKFVANRLTKQLGHDLVFEQVEQPFSFMDRICLREKNNFFEGKVSAYKMFADKEDSDEDAYGDL